MWYKCSWTNQNQSKAHGLFCTGTRLLVLGMKDSFGGAAALSHAAVFIFQQQVYS